MSHLSRSLLSILLITVAAGAVLADLEPVGTEFWLAWPFTSDVTPDDADYDLDGQIIILTESTVPVPVSVAGTGLAWSGSTVKGTPALVRVPRSLMVETDGVDEVAILSHGSAAGENSLHPVNAGKRSGHDASE